MLIDSAMVNKFFESLEANDIDTCTDTFKALYNGYKYFGCELYVNITIQAINVNIIHSDIVVPGFGTYLAYSLIMGTLISSKLKKSNFDELFPWWNKAVASYVNMHGVLEELFAAEPVCELIDTFLKIEEYTHSDVREFINVVESANPENAINLPIAKFAIMYLEEVDKYANKFLSKELTQKDIDSIIKQVNAMVFFLAHNRMNESGKE